MNDRVKSRIDGLVRSKRVVLFMKGSAMTPMCGLSASALQTLRAAGAREIATFDLLMDPELREGVKEYSSSQSIPVIFVDGRCVGGSDKLRELFDRGELTSLVQ